MKTCKTAMRRTVNGYTIYTGFDLPEKIRRKCGGSKKKHEKLFEAVKQIKVGECIQLKHSLEKTICYGYFKALGFSLVREGNIVWRTA